MKKKAYLVFLLCLIPAALFAEGDGAVSYGILSLLPPLLAIVLAFVTRQVILSLFLGVFSGALMINNWNPVIAFLRTLDTYLVNSLADGWYAAIIIFTLSIGGMIGIVNKMGGTQAIANALAKKAKTPRSAMLVTSVLGVIVFFDDYANTLIVGPTMRPLMDKMKVSREKLSYIVDSTAAPVVGLALISTWVGMELGLFGDAFTALGVDINPFGVFIRTIPYTFYNIFALVLVFMLSARGRDYGPMLKAEKRARLTGQVYRDGANLMAELSDSSAVSEDDSKKLRAANAIVPVLTLVLVSFIGLWYNGYSGLEDAPAWYSFKGIQESFGNADASVVLIWGAISSAIVAGIMALSQKIMKLGEVFDAFVDGSKSLLITAIILVLAWSLGAVASEVGTADYLVGAVSDKVPGGLIPILVFLISMLVAFSTGTSWGTMAIVIPLAVPLAAAYVDGDPSKAPLVIAALSAVLSGSIFGDHCSPISDTTIMSSMASGSDHIDHVKTQIPYALTGAGVAFLGYVLVGILHVPVAVALLIGVAAIWAIVQFVGKKPEEA
ncbi:MAG: Na+/H+ antiporter NhaC family protein [Spirochaetales bacterium]|nr:Na+/H+ antiporter NhaC family protein [Spirochaetales bacterium]